MNQSTFFSLLAALLVGAVSGFSSTIQQTTRGVVLQFGLSGGGSRASSKLFLAKIEGSYRGDFPPEEESEEFTGSVDWDAEWKKVVATDGKLPSGGERPPGRNFCKSEAEIVTIKVAPKNKASDEKVVDLSVISVSNDAMPGMRSLASDWRVSNKNPSMTAM
jgi:hypothetical protein